MPAERNAGSSSRATENLVADAAEPPNRGPFVGLPDAIGSTTFSAGQMSRARTRILLLLFAGTSFASACLIFVVQPMVGKRILPWFGGVPAVWMLCLAFYQTALFAGYAWAHWLVRGVQSGRQLALHALLFMGAALALPVLPGEAWKPQGAVEPSGAILAMLAVNVAPAFLVLAATGPLLQAWFARCQPERSPYPLYAVSNLGSLLALLGYPFLLESRLSLSTSGRLWSAAFVVTGLAVLACGALARRARPLDWEAPADGGGTPPLRQAPAALWLLLAACAVVLLMGVTNELCLDVASVPFLWILPLATYLTTFILCFGSRRSPRRVISVSLTLLVLGVQFLARRASEGEGSLAAVAESIQVQILLHCLFLFGACMVLHGELHRLRPAPSRLTTFYMCVSGGGALGGLFVGIVAPIVFDDYLELPIGVGLGCLLLLAACWYDDQGWLRRHAPRWHWALAGALTGIVLVNLATGALGRLENVLHQERGFFGVLRVRQVGERANTQRQLFNGTTLHGLQLVGGAQRPTSYYGVLTGIGLALTQRRPEVPSRIGVVGLGIGTLAAYGRRGDRLRFYEIDPAVVRLASDPAYFTFLARSAAEIEIVEGDGRIALEGERDASSPSRFGLLVVDAFSSDAIPVHLLTREALAVYLGVLDPEGLLAVHSSNRHFELEPVLGQLARDAGLRVLVIENDPLPRRLSARATWVFLSRSGNRLRALATFAEQRSRALGLDRQAIRTRVPTPRGLAESPVWTDDYIDLLGAMRPLPVRLGGPGGS